ncbi:MAG TPA: SRPBCC family protein [Candidatus Dormibacteraeota bacterium]|jgi:carbon monoxide dehydrogenase subunit G
MQFENRFSVKAPIATVWDTLLDVERVAPCLPGAKVLERTGEDQYVVGMRVKIGPISMEYKGNVEILTQDAVAHRASLHGIGRELRGQGAAEADVEMLLTEEGGETVATIKTDVKLSGRVASMGQGVIGEVSKKLVDTFSINLAGMLAAPVEAPVLDGASPSTAAVAVARPFVPSDDASLPVLSVMGSVVMGRVRSPRVAVPVGLVIAVLVALVLWLWLR